MEIAITHEQGYVLAVCTGPINDAAQQPFRNVIHPLFADKGVKVLMDIAGVNWLNSEGIAAMVRLATDANSRGCRIVFAAPGAFVTEVLRVTRLENFFDIAATRSEGLAILEVDGVPSTSS